MAYRYRGRGRGYRRRGYGRRGWGGRSYGGFRRNRMGSRYLRRRYTGAYRRFTRSGPRRRRYGYYMGGRRY